MNTMLGITADAGSRGLYGVLVGGAAACACAGRRAGDVPPPNKMGGKS